MTSGLKQAALCLHSLEEADRLWLLEQLPESKRFELNMLLDELITLGIPQEQSWISGGLLKSSESEEKNLTEKQDDCDAQNLLSANAVEIWQILKLESEAVISAIVYYRQWPWQSAVLKKYKKAHRRVLSKYAELAPNVYSVLILELSKRLNDLRQHDEIKDQPTRKGRFFQNTMSKLAWRR